MHDLIPSRLFAFAQDGWTLGPPHVGLLGLVVFVLDLVAIGSVITSPGSVLRKVVWIIAILCLPVLGMLLYFLFADRK